MDLKFLYNKYIHHRRIFDNLKLDYAGGLIDAQEDFLKPYILKKGNLMLDIGANSGAWSIRANKYYNQIIAFEPYNKTFKILQRNIKMNKAFNIKPLNIALGSQNGEQRLFLRDDKTGGSHSLLQEHMNMKAIDHVLVKIRTLDSLHLRPSLIKIDTEGAAYEIVKGGLQTIIYCRPVLCIETHTVEEQLIPDLLTQYTFKEYYRSMPSGPQLFLVGICE